MSEHLSADARDEVKRLVVCFDGTWNTLADRTNVARIHAAIADEATGCPHQLKFYDEGVGTAAMSRVRGGALGWGLDQNILEGYCWLINHYHAQATRVEGSERFADGPGLFIFGFSRGAFTARSLAGLINRCGILKAEHFALEPKGCAHPGAALVREAWELYRKPYPAGVEARYERECANFREQHAWNVKIRFIGVWDTVGALGVPMFSNTTLARMKYGFHDTALGRVVENAFHAVAIDEQREDYAATLWTKKREGQNVEQRWFPGAHANVGGGYENDHLPSAPLEWIAERAIAAGLEFTDPDKLRTAQRPACTNALPDEFRLLGTECLSPVRDSYADFMYGAYRFLRALVLRGRYYRPVLKDGVAESVDETAYMKWDADPSYRPKNLVRDSRGPVLRAVR